MKRTHYLKLFLYSAILISSIILVWMISYQLYCFALIIPILSILIISYGFIELKIFIRDCIKNCYIKDKTIVYNILSSKIFISIISLIFSTVFTLSIFIQLIFYEYTIWLYLIFHLFIMIIIYLFLKRYIKVFITKKAINLIAMKWSINIGMVLIIISFFYITLNGYTPLYLDESLNITILNASNSVASNCPLINKIIKFKAELESIFWWITDQTTGQIDIVAIKFTLWSLFIFINSLALIGINRFIVTIIYILDQILAQRGLDEI